MKEEYTYYSEGKVKFLAPIINKEEIKHGFSPSKLPVFFNPKAKLSRDFSVIVVKILSKNFKEPIRICEPLAGCGIRTIRILKEANNIEKAIVGDINPKALEIIKHNIVLNKVENYVEAYNIDANYLLLSHAISRKKFHYIDIDPTGSPAPFLENAFKSLEKNGIIGFTATDIAPLCGTYPKTCIRKYYAKPLRSPFSKEIALRILIGFAALIAARFELSFTPIISFFNEYYIRIFGKIDKGARKADKNLEKLGWVTYCKKCLHREVIEGIWSKIDYYCQFCNSKKDYAGPLWIGNTCDKNFCQEMLNEIEINENYFNNFSKAKKIIELLKGEVDYPPFYYVSHEISSYIKKPPPKLNYIIEKIISKKFSAVLTHYDPKGFKTNAPLEVILEVFRSY
ncbi:MAG: tRNA (guanine(10)-N(2))-dimethyltransferase [Nitrososphaerota archaeon]